MVRILRCARGTVALAMVTGVLAVGDRTGAQERTLRIEFLPDGSMNLAAARVSVRDIVAEWARLCDCYIVNGDKLSTAPIPVPVEFTRTPQAAVLESLLRGTTGYALTPRRAAHAGASTYETIYIVASSQASAVAAPTYQPPIQAPVALPIATPLPTRGAPEDEIPPVQPGTPTQSLPMMPQQPRDGALPEAPQQPSAPPRNPSPGVSVPAVTVPMGSPVAQPVVPVPGLPIPMPQPRTPGSN